MSIFSDEMLARVVEGIRKESRGKLQFVDLEIQDRGSSILILCDYVGSPNDIELELISADVKRFLDPMIPKFEGSPSWTINVYFKRTLIYCIVGDGDW